MTNDTDANLRVAFATWWNENFDWPHANSGPMEKHTKKAFTAGRADYDALAAKLAEVEAQRDEMRMLKNNAQFHEKKQIARAEATETDLTAARAALVTARNEALEEAAKVADRAEEYRAQQLSEEAGVRDYTQRQRWQAGKVQAELIAKNIRALATPQEKADE